MVRPGRAPCFAYRENHSGRWIMLEYIFNVWVGSILATAVFTGAARMLFLAGDKMGDGGFGMAALGYICLVAATVGAFFFLSKIATVGV